MSLFNSGTPGLLQQLRQPDSQILIDDTSGSWIASTPSIGLLFGNLGAPLIISRYGRRGVSLYGAIIIVIAWGCIFFASSVKTLLIYRFLNGFGSGLSFSSGPMLIGEYTSPKYRGMFLMMISFSASLMHLLAHQLLFSIDWRISSVISGVYSTIAMVVIALSPESPSWLINKGRYEEGRTVFRWLREEGEEEELDKIIEANVELVKRTRKTSVKRSIKRRLCYHMVYIRSIAVKKEFYKPIIIMIHVVTIGCWSGHSVFSTYVDETFRVFDLGDLISVTILILIADVNRILTSFLAIYLIKSMTLRKLYFTSVVFNILMLLLTASYMFARNSGILPFDHPAIAIILSNVLIFSISVGPLSLSYGISGEIFPLEFKNISGAINAYIYAVHGFASILSFPYCNKSFGLHGTYCLYAGMMTYCAVVTWYTLPETKDRTLQDIEDQFRERSTVQGQTADTLISGRIDPSERN